MDSPVLVTGGTGTLGRHVVSRLREAGRDVRVLTRHEHRGEPGLEYVARDLSTGAGLDPALDGCHTVIHLAGDGRHDAAITATLVEGCRRAAVQHLVYVSVTAADLIPIGYYRGKAAGEKLVADSGVPWSTLRAAQFHDLVLSVFSALGKSPVLLVPSGIRLQPVDTREVAAQLAEIALGDPVGMAPSLTGPDVLTTAELADAYLAATGKRRLRLPVPLPGKIGHTYRNGDNLELDADNGRLTWPEFLRERCQSD